MKMQINAKSVFTYLKIALLALLLCIEIVVCAQAYTIDVNLANFITIIICCAVLAAIEAFNTFLIKGFAAKMVIFGVDSALLLAINLLTGNSFLSTLYCVVLTGCYMTVDKFKDRTIIFGVSCGLYSISIVIGWVINHYGASLYQSVVEISTAVLFGLIAIVVDYLVVQFILKFYNTNLKLRAALAEADKSRAELEEASEQLTQTKVFEERNRIAKDIHDNAGHSMTTVIMQTEAAKLLIDTDPQEAKNRIISANIQARNALEQMRDSVHLLAGRAKVRSLREEIEEIIAQTMDGTDIKARYDVDDVNADEEQFRFVCNSVKELVANAIRHGKATALYIELKEVFGNINLLVSDNGTGVKGEIEEGFGLRGIREKAENMGGKCTYVSEEGNGFEVEITLPIKKGEKADD